MRSRGSARIAAASHTQTTSGNAPTAPFGWIDRPPSLNRVIGLKWLAGLFYPDRIKQDLRETTQSFYRLFYHVEPSDTELDTLIAWSKGQAPSAARQPRR